MHDEIFLKEQNQLLPLIKTFSDQFGLVGGTAIALQIGHRRSIDFDLFTLNDFDNNRIRQIIRKSFLIQKTFIENPQELTLLVDNVKLTFYKYPFEITFDEELKGIIKMPDLLTLATMKSFALGKRAKWKDYVDLYFIFKECSINEVIAKTKKIFSSEFNEKLFREELSYFDDIDYSETIDYLPGFELEDKVVKESLKEISLTF